MALPVELARRADRALSSLSSYVARQHQAVEAASGWWSGLIGAGSSYDALKTNESASEKYLTVMRTKRTKLASVADVEAFERNIAEMVGTGPSPAETAAELLTPGHAAKEVATETAKDIGKGLKLGLPVVLLVVVAVGWVWFAPRRR